LPILHLERRQLLIGAPARRPIKQTHGVIVQLAKQQIEQVTPANSVDANPPALVGQKSTVMPSPELVIRTPITRSGPNRSTTVSA
jgi:hypothetical protein